ncbi:aspartate/glutamate racemase family protein [Rhizobium sp. LC145]|jgi:allantoin racemase|uniref:aspartate/glutamate racemase family protein n=1 Tax=Rhizobium sp. LC145 TaxID=1120688 RepID=UPI00062A34ED|nr:aspartate/glutamate racemase family protein [Rhizobium sp. LC145]KKX26298.1 hypothetical protein YH62_24280 [Rhizobium sp. LC145]TKT67152.1 aspartate/glutamate racemase family protein [Rhizobiaceae bacterium LC148]
MSRILLINPNSNRETTEAMVAIAASAMPDHHFAGRTAPFGESMIVEPQALVIGARAVSAILAGEIAEGTVFDGAIIAAFGDPGLDEARRLGTVPVCGIGEASFHEAGAAGRSFAVATTTPALERAIAERVEKTGLSSRFIGSFFTPGDPFAVIADPARLKEELSLTVEAAIRAGAEAVIIGGGPLAMAARDLGRRHAVPIIEPVPAAARRIAAMLHPC